MNTLENKIVAEKCGTIVVDVFKTIDNLTLFHVESDNKDIINVSEIIEDALCKY